MNRIKVYMHVYRVPDREMLLSLLDAEEILGT